MSSSNADIKRAAMFNHWLKDLTHLCIMVNFEQNLMARKFYEWLTFEQQTLTNG